MSRYIVAGFMIYYSWNNKLAFKLKAISHLIRVILWIIFLKFYISFKYNFYNFIIIFL